MSNIPGNLSLCASSFTDHYQGIGSFSYCPHGSPVFYVLTRHGLALGYSSPTTYDLSPSSLDLVVDLLIFSLK